MFFRLPSRLWLPKNIVPFAPSLSSHSVGKSHALRLSSLRSIHTPHSRGFRVQRNWYQGRTYQKVEASSWAIVIAAAAIGGSAAAIAVFSQQARGASADTGIGDAVKASVVSGNLEMPVNTLPGHLGNLTAEQETKLKELWGLLLRVCGVRSTVTTGSGLVEDALDSTDTPTEGTATPTTTDKEKKKSKKRLGIFKKDKDSKEPNSSTASDAGITSPGSTISTDDDKYGQTKEFQETLANLSPEELRAAFWSMVKQDHPDALLLRFLRARKWDVEKALVMLIATIRWRAHDAHVDDDVITNGEPAALETSQSSDKAAAKEADDFLVQLRLGKSFLHGCDKEGRPICHVRVRFHRQGEQSVTSLERYTVFVIETARYMLSPPVETAVSIPLLS